MNQLRVPGILTLAAVLLVALPVASAKPPHAQGDSPPPGLAKQGKLPPGWEKKLHRGAVLDHDIYEHAHKLPAHETVYEEPEGVITISIGGKIARVVEETHEVIEVISH